MTTMPNLVRRGSEDSLSLESAINILLELGIQRKHLRVIAEGGFNRFRGGIIHQKPIEGTSIDHDSEVILTVTESGLYDALPEGVFSANGTFEHKQKEVEELIRNFFTTFESYLFQTSSTLKYIGDVSNLIFHDELLSKSFISYFGFSYRGWDVEDLMIWRTLLPYAPAWVGTKWGIEMIMNAFFGLNAKIIENISHKNNIPAEIRNRLGKDTSSLGENFLLGKSFAETYSTFRLCLGPISIQQFPEFLPGEKKRKKLERILEFAIPGDMTYEIQLILDKENQRFVLEEVAGCNLLGHSTYLG